MKKSKPENEQSSKIVKKKPILLLKSLSWLKDLIPITLIIRKILSILYKISQIVQMSAGVNIQNWLISLSIQKCGRMKTAKGIWRYIEN